ncbi:DUF6086 family protein [Streptomyces klenkii]|uniref:DUF6086 family protein n=1 Tax=Streptomyces klenkii TaxID=1420899 RepID=UPI0018F69BF1
MEVRLGQTGNGIACKDENGQPVVFITEDKETEQHGHLPPEAAVRLAWQEPVDAPNPSNGASRLFMSQVSVYQAELGLPSGIGPNAG